MKSLVVSCCLTVVFIFFSVARATCATDDQYEVKETFGLWSLTCRKGVEQPNPKNCALTAAVHAEDKPDLWVKVALAHGGPTDRLELTVRTPILKYFRNGISLGFDGRQAVKGYVDTCASYCESLITFDDRLINQIGTAAQMSIEYQIDEAKSVLLPLNLDQMIPALAALEKNAGLSDLFVASFDQTKNFNITMRYVLERRVFDASPSTAAWQAPLQKCSDIQSKKIVLVNHDMTVENQDDAIKWGIKSSKCGGFSTVWIKADESVKQSSTANSLKLGSFAIYNVMNRVVTTGLVPTDSSTVALQPELHILSNNKLLPGSEYEK